MKLVSNYMSVYHYVIVSLAFDLPPWPSRPLVSIYAVEAKAHIRRNAARPPNAAKWMKKGTETSQSVKS